MHAFKLLSPELVEHVFELTQDGTPSINRVTLLRLGLVSQQFAPIAKRLLYRHIRIDEPAVGAQLLHTLRHPRAERLADFVRTLKITDPALSQRDVFSDLSQDDLLRQTSNLVEFESPVSAFAPLSDGRRPFATYPATLKSVRLSPTFHRWSAARYEDEYDSDESNLDEGSAISASDALSTLSSLPTALTSLVIASTFVPDLSTSPGGSPLQHLKSLVLDFTSTPYSTVKWLTASSIANRTLTDLKVWNCAAITEDNLVELLNRCSLELESFTFKPASGLSGTKFPALRLIRQARAPACTPCLLRLSLGNKAADHTLYALLPRSLTHLTVSLPENHVNARLADIEAVIRTRLRKLVKLDLYSQIYFPSPKVDYPRSHRSDATTLREIRLSHINTPAGALDAFLASVGSTVHTLALHHVSAQFSSTLVSHCPKLRRLELGRSPSSAYVAYNQPLCRFSATDHAYLHSLRVHFDAGVSVDNLVGELEAARVGGTRLGTLTLVGAFPADLVLDRAAGWTRADAIDRLVRVARDVGTVLVINGKMVESFGDLWIALLTGACSTY
ncbi:hypothetical protein JCM11491_002051 [Sporobolomyces phaffii]